MKMHNYATLLCLGTALRIKQFSILDIALVHPMHSGDAILTVEKELSRTSLNHPQNSKSIRLDFRFFELYRSVEYVTLILEGTAVSAAITLAGGVFGFLVAFSLAAVRYWSVPVLDKCAAFYIDFIRNTPLIVQLFFIAFGLPQLLGYVWPFWCHALLALTINFSGYFAEILRSGFATTQKGQLEAAAALNLSRANIFSSIIVPQTLIKMYPSLSSQFIFLFLTTGVISEIGVVDLTHAGLFIDSRTFRSFEVFITLTFIYVGVALCFKAMLQFIYWKTLGKRVA